MKTLFIIRTEINLKDKFSDSYLKAITNRALKEGVNVQVLKNNPINGNAWNEKEIELASKCLRNTLVLEPCEFNFNRDLTLDRHLTAKAIFNSIKSFNDIKIVAILNRSELIGKPLFNMLIDNNYIPVMLHSKCNITDMVNIINMADIVVSATGKDMTNLFDICRINKLLLIDVSNDYNGKQILKLADQTFIGKKTLDLLFKNIN